MASDDRVRPVGFRGAGNCFRLQISVWAIHAILVLVLVSSIISNNLQPPQAAHYQVGLSGGGGGGPYDGVERIVRVPSSSADSRDRMCGGLPSFEEFFRSNHQGYGLHKWVHYFDTYETHLRPYCAVKDLRMIEIGLQSGGSVAMWKGVMGDSLQVSCVLRTKPTNLV